MQQYKGSTTDPNQRLVSLPKVLDGQVSIRAQSKATH